MRMGLFLIALIAFLPWAYGQQDQPKQRVRPMPDYTDFPKPKTPRLWDLRMSLGFARSDLKERLLTRETNTAGLKSIPTAEVRVEKLNSSRWNWPSQFAFSNFSSLESVNIPAGYAIGTGIKRSRLFVVDRFLGTYCVIAPEALLEFERFGQASPDTDTPGIPLGTRLNSVLWFEPGFSAGMEWDSGFWLELKLSLLRSIFVSSSHNGSRLTKNVGGWGIALNADIGIGGDFFLELGYKGNSLDGDATLSRAAVKILLGLRL